MKSKEQIENRIKFNDKSTFGRVFISAAGLALMLSGAPAYAAKPGTPPADSGREVVLDAADACNSIPLVSQELDEIKTAACDLLYATDGVQDTSHPKCDELISVSVLNANGGPTIYLLRNCDKNEAAQQKKAASIILSIEDKAKGKETATTAASYACDYAAKAEILQAIGKLVYSPDDINLADDAREIAEALLNFGSLIETCD